MKNGSTKRTHRLGLIGLAMIVISLAALLPVAVAFAEAESQPASGSTLFGIAFVSGANTLVVVDPVTGGLTPVGSFPGFFYVVQGVSALDAANQRYFFPMAEKLFVVNTQTGAVIANPPFPFSGGSLEFQPPSPTGVVEESEVPTGFALMQSYPNPFNPTTTIEYHVPVSGVVKLSVFDMLGREIAVLVNGNVQAGKHKVTFDASSLAAGVYFYHMQAGKFQETRKFVILK